MVFNPLDDNDPELRARIQERAYHLWQEDGGPHGRDREYWERARELVGIELAGQTGQLPHPAERPELAEEAAIQENLGEFPDRFADQGEKTATPKAKAKPKIRKPAAPAEAAASGDVTKAAPKKSPAKKKPA